MVKKPSKEEREQEESRRHYDARQRLVILASDWANDFSQASTAQEIEAEIRHMESFLEEVRAKRS